MIALLLLACTGATDDDSGEASDTPTVRFLAPEDGATVPAGTLDVSVVVEHFTLEDPAKHNDGEPEGYLHLSVHQGDLTEVTFSGDTTFEITLQPGSATLGADLYFADGDPISETFPDFAPAEVSLTVE